VSCAGGVSSGNGGVPGEVGQRGEPSKGFSGRVEQAAAAPTNLVDVATLGDYQGQACYLVVAETAPAAPENIGRTLQVSSVALQQNIPACPAQPAAAGTAPPLVAAPAVSPAQLAEAFWYTIHLPVPKPASSPDYATTGKPTYLSAGDTADPPSWTRATLLGTLTITAHGSYTVNWGDGSPPTGPYTNPGGPFPTGTMTHTYDDVGTVTIAVAEQWTATWTIGAAHGVLIDLRTSGTLPDFPVRQIQAVITG
jgi:hypothetical protein